MSHARGRAWWLAGLLAAAACSGQDPGSFAVNCRVADPADEARLPTGPRPQGGHVLVDGRLVTPWGEQLTFGSFPLGLLPLGRRHVAVTDGGFGDQRLQVIDLVGRTVTAADTLAPDEGAFFYGLAFDGRRLWAAGGGGRQGDPDGSSAIHVYDVDLEAGALGPRREVVTDGFPAGLALSADGATLVVARHRGNGVTLIDTALEEVSATVDFTSPADSFPYAVATTPAGCGRDEAYVSLLGASQVAIVDLSTGDVSYVPVGKGPAALAVAPGGRLLVANADSDSISVVDLESREVVLTRPLGDGPDAPRGLAPTALALTPDGGRLLVALSGENAVDVLDLSTLERLGRVPTGWYPTAVSWHAAPDQLLILNAKGVGAGAEGKRTSDGDGTTLMPGTLSIVADLDDLGLLEGALAVAANNAWPQATAPKLECDGEPHRFPLPENAGDPTPIKHVVLIVRQNKTYDAVLGDLEGANGDPSLAVWGERVTPNLHALARQFAVLDNFYSNAEESTLGREWTAGGTGNDFSEKAWLSVGGRATRPGSDLVTVAAAPERGYVWQQLEAAGVAYIDFGEPTGADDRTVIAPGFPGGQYDLGVLDTYKAAYVAERIRRYGLSRFTYLLLPNDDTYGAASGLPTPEAMIADNDAATGIIVAALARSPLWSRTVVFVVEAGARDGADHVDAHRVPCLAIGPWVRHGHVSSVHYAYPSLWRTITLLLGMPPLGRHDATAASMADVFATRPDATTYDALPPRVPLVENP